MTSSREDYLKVIYEEGGLENFVSNKVIAEKLGIAPASVSEMIVRLSKEGLIYYEAYKGSKLTDEGLESCIGVVRTHRLWEVFLMRHLGYSWREAHEDAHILEHATPERMVDRLDKFLNFPKTCPHGSVIPQKGEIIAEEEFFITLADLQTGDEVTVKKINEDVKLLDYVEKTGLKIGELVKILEIDDYEGPIKFKQDERIIQISFKAASQIYVKK